MSYILALDQGTTSSRALLFDRDGRIKGAAQREFRQGFPKPGWVEHDPEEIWSSQAGVAVEVLGAAGVRARDVAAIGIANQRETTIVWDRKTGRPIANAIVWQDRRTADVCDRLRSEGAEPLFRERTGLVLDAYFSGTKLAWILDNVDGARARAEAGDLAFGTVDSWLLWKLTDGRLHITDASNASRTLMFNIHTLQWDDELLRALHVPRSVLPDVRSSSEIYGEVTATPGLQSVAVAGIAGDQQAALFGQMCTSPGLTKNTYGTGCFMLQNTGANAPVSQHQLLTTIAWTRNGAAEYALEGSVFIGGAVVQWLRDGLGIIRSSSDVETLARSVLGYFAANCGTCHNRSGETTVSGPSLKHSDLSDGDATIAGLLAYATAWQVPGQPEGTSRMLDAATPDASAMLARMRSRRPSSQMPPLGTVLRDEQAIEAVTRWLAADLARR